MSSTYLTDFQNLNVKNIIFSETYNGKYSKFIPIGYSCDDQDEEIHKLILNTPPNLFTNGIIPKYDNKTRTDIVGYNMFINMWNKRDGPTEEQKLFCDKLEEILKYMKAFLTSIKEELNIDQKLIDDLRILSSFGSNEDSEDYQPKLFCKLMLNNKSKKILTQFINEETNEMIDPKDLIKKNGLVTTALKFENISISDSRITLEIRVFEVLYKELKKSKRTSILKPEIEISSNKKFYMNKNKAVDDDKRKNKMPVNQNPFSALSVEED